MKHNSKSQRRKIARTSIITGVVALIAVCIGGMVGAAVTATPTATVTLTCNGVVPTSSISGDTLTGKCPGAVVVPPTTTTTTAPKPPPTTTTTVPPTTTTTTTPASGGTCIKPVTTLTGTEDTINTDPGAVENWWVSQDEWGGSPPQSLKVCNQASWTVTDNVTLNNGDGVQVYPDTEYDVNGRNGAYPSTKATSAYNSITSTFSESNTLSNSDYDAAYDLWTNNWTNETMIWNQWGGADKVGSAYWGACAEPGPEQNDCVGQGGANAKSVAVTLNGVLYHFLSLGGVGGEQMFFRDTQVTSGSVDILAALKFEVTQGDAKSTDAPTQLEYGVELVDTNGPQTFSVNGLTFNLS